MTNIAAEWKIAGLATLPIRFVQGWIFWGGGSRRFIYDPSKLDPHSHVWMANKLQSAMPGAILGVDKIISFLLLHFYLLYISIIIFSLIELFSGLALILGFCTRTAAFMTILVSITLMLAFGWQGATCMDEWTMAVATFAMGCTLTLSGASAFSIDNLLTRRYPTFTSRNWFSYFFSGAIENYYFKSLVTIIFIITMIFTLSTYNYYRGSIVTPYHSGPVSAGTHHIAISDASITSTGIIKLTLYVDAGTPALPSNIIRIELLNDKNEILKEWNGNALHVLPATSLKNIYAYNQASIGDYGIVMPLSSKTNLTLNAGIDIKSSHTILRIFTINGDSYKTTLQYQSPS